jgi:hypothetical protein
MEISRWIFAKAFIITVLILVIIYSANVFLNSKREISVADDMDETVETLQEMQALTEMMNMFGENATCLTLKSQLKVLDKQTWSLGNKIDEYHRLAQEYATDPNYLKQKRKFNRQEVLYLALLKQIRSKCDINQSIILYFYRKGEDCKFCDQQAFVLTHMNQKIDEELAIFSFAADMDIPSVSVLIDEYNVTDYPCIVIEDETYCGLRDRQEVEKILCEKSQWLSLCPKPPT